MSKTFLGPIVIGLAILSLSLIAAPARSAEERPWEKGPIKAEMAVSFGGPLVIGLTKAFGQEYDELASTPATIGFDLRLGLTKFSLMTLEASALMAHGFGANLIIDWFRWKRVNIHLLDPGIFRYGKMQNFVSITNVPRKYDWTFGGGIDFRINRRYAVGLNWRAFLPDPINVGLEYGNFLVLMIRESLKGGQTWLRFSYVF